MAADDLSSAISTAAQTPAAVSGDAGSVTARPVGDQIAADRYLAAKAARRQRLRGVSFSKIIAAGPFPDSQGTNLGNQSGFGGGG